MGTEVVARTKYIGHEIVIGVKTWVDLITLGEMEFDNIEGDWIFTYHASVYCYEKKMILRIDGIPEFTIEGVLIHIGHQLYL